MTDFAAIDFETANYNHSSVCAVGVIIVRNNKIADTYYSLIRPVPNSYLEWFTEDIHGISYEDTLEAKPFPEIWSEIMPKIEGLTLVAHNSQFDEGCLKAAHKAYKIPYPQYTFQCTCKASRRVFGKNLPDHRLPTVAKKCGFDLLNHHNALADAEACAVIAQKIL
ncbi:MAG: 3'-5' exonuclease [Spirochaetaceae bacterium]|jgi:DNA polymerase-3 subunit epsilon|nr:3'-5' exonuclease [Spirochaetaceae bacterium]